MFLLLLTSFSVQAKGPELCSLLLQEMASSWSSMPLRNVYEQTMLDDDFSIGGERAVKFTSRIIERHTITIENGILYDHLGKRISTKNAKNLRSRNPKEGYAIFVIDSDFRLIIRNISAIFRIHHSSLTNKQVLFAGEIVVEDGIIKSITNKSGHYLTPSEYIIDLIRYFEINGVAADTVDYDIGSF